MAIFIKTKIRKKVPGKLFINNYARGGIGILQMHDIANYELSLNNYDTILFVYISDDLDRARSWKKSSQINERHKVIKRFYDKNNNSQNFRFTKNLVDNKLSKEICIELTNKNNKSKKFYTKNEKIFIELSKHDFKKKYDIKNDKEILEKFFFSKIF